MKIHILVDDKVRRQGFVAEHGLSILIEVNNLKILFDLGATDIFQKNAHHKKLGLDNLDYVIISHGHYDHCDGLANLQPAPQTKILIQEAGLNEKYAKDKETGISRKIGLTNKKIICHNLKSNLVKINGDYKITDNIMLINNIPMSNDFEKIAEMFFCSKNKEMKNDFFIDEQILVINSEKGLVVFSGCSHLGIINGLDSVKKHYPNVPIHALFAGMHLEKASESLINKTIEGLEKFDISFIYPLHCTGLMATAKLKMHFQERCLLVSTSDTIEI